MAASPPARADRSGSGHGSSPVARRGLFERLSAGSPAGVTLVSAPAGSGKTVLLRSWVDDSGLADRVAWLTVERDQRDPQRFWLAAVEKLRAAVGADAFIEKLSPAPDFDGHALVERLLSELGSLEDPVVLVIDDLHELHAPEALAQLELLLDRRPPLLWVVLATRRDPQLGLHRLRLAGELTEVRASDLRFTLDETRELLAASGIAPSDEAIAMLHARTEGWAAGLRLAALSLAGHPDPERFVAEFSGSERTVADYLLAEVLERQPEDVRRLLLRTSILERVNGALADVARWSHRVGADPARARAGQRLRRLRRRRACVVSLPRALRRPPAPGVAPHRPERRRRAAPCRGGMAGRARVRGRGDQARAGCRRLAACRSPGRRPQLQPLARRSGSDGARVARRLPGERPLRS